MKRQRPETWEEYQRLRRRYLMGLEMAAPLRPSPEARAEYAAAHAKGAAVAVLEREPEPPEPPEEPVEASAPFSRDTLTRDQAMGMTIADLKAYAAEHGAPEPKGQKAAIVDALTAVGLVQDG